MRFATCIFAIFLVFRIRIAILVATARGFFCIVIVTHRWHSICVLLILFPLAQNERNQGSILFALCLSSALSLPVSNDREIDCIPTDGWSVIATTDNSESSEPALSQLIITLGTDFAEEPSEADAEAFFANFEDTLGTVL